MIASLPFIKLYYNEKVKAFLSIHRQKFNEYEKSYVELQTSWCKNSYFTIQPKLIVPYIKGPYSRAGMILYMSVNLSKFVKKIPT